MNQRDFTKSLLIGTNKLARINDLMTWCAISDIVESLLNTGLV